MSKKDDRIAELEQKVEELNHLLREEKNQTNYWFLLYVKELGKKFPQYEPTLGFPQRPLTVPYQPPYFPINY